MQDSEKTLYDDEVISSPRIFAETFLKHLSEQEEEERALEILIDMVSKRDGQIIDNIHEK